MDSMQKYFLNSSSNMWERMQAIVILGEDDFPMWGVYFELTRTQKAVMNWR